jgi:hypothetical protein
VLESHLPRNARAAVIGLVILPTFAVSNIIFHEHVVGGDPRRYAAFGYLSHSNTALIVLSAIFLGLRAKRGRVPSARG